MPRKPVFSECTAALLLLLALLCASCAIQRTSSPPTSHYILEYKPPVFPAQQPLATTLRIVPFDAAPAFDTYRMVYQTGKYKLASYHYQAWIAKPAALVRFFLERDLRRAGLLTAVLTDSSRFSPAYLLGGTVEKFLEVDKGEHWQAVLSLDIILQRRPEDGGMAKVLGQRHYTVQKACPRKEPQAVAEAMSQAMAELSKRIQQDLYTLIKNDLANKTGG